MSINRLRTAPLIGRQSPPATLVDSLLLLLMGSTEFAVYNQNAAVRCPSPTATVRPAALHHPRRRIPRIQSATVIAAFFSAPPFFLRSASPTKLCALHRSPLPPHSANHPIALLARSTADRPCTVCWISCRRRDRPTSTVGAEATTSSPSVTK
jgi:hypothetical protein